MKILHKIGLVGLVPILALVAYSFVVIGPRATLVKDASRWETSLRLIQDCSHFVHVIQVERGASATYLNGGFTKDRLQTVRQKTDLERENFVSGIAANSPDAATTKVLMNQLEKLSALRNQVDLQEPAPDVIAGFTGLVAQVVSVQDAAVRQKTGKGLGKRMTTLLIVEMAKETCGQLRAILSSTIAKDGPVDHLKIDTLAARIYGVEAGMNAPGMVMNKENSQRLKEIQESHNWSYLKAAYYQVMEKSQTGGYGYDANVVFDNSTAFIDELGLMLFDQQQRVIDKAENIKNQARRDLVLWTLVLLGALAFSVGLLIYFTRDITRPLNQAVALARGAAEGDLTLRLEEQSNDETGQLVKALNSMISSLESKAQIAERIAEKDLTVKVAMASDKDTLGSALSRMVSSLGELIYEARGNSNRVSKGSREVASASQNLSQGSTEQAANLQEISSSMEQLSHTTRENATHASEAKELTDKAKEDSTGGISDMEQMVGSMEEINEASQKIGRIINTVDDIAFQTNLLALNAAVEAARAGKHGKGFAVVAEEVRSLAGRSAKAARETSQLIEDSYVKVAQGTELADRAATSFRDIVQGVSHAAGLVGEISTAANDQAQSLGEITEGLRQVDMVVQNSTASSEELASAADELAAQSNSLEQQLDQFRIDAQKSKAAPAAPLAVKSAETAADEWALV